MAGYSKVNITNAREAINSIIDGLNYETSKNIIDSANDSTYWQGDSKQTLINALNKQVNTNYKNLKDKLDNYLVIVDYMESWKELDDDNDWYAQKRDEAESKILEWKWQYKKDKYGNYVYDYYGNREKEWYQVTNKYWKNKYNEYKDKIAKNKATMESYVNKIEELI